MNREEAKKLLPIITAFAEGKTVQYKDYATGWTDADGYGLTFSYSPEMYRIKPEPKKLYMVVNCRGNQVGDITRDRSVASNAADCYNSSPNVYQLCPYKVEEYAQVMPEEKE